MYMTAETAWQGADLSCDGCTEDLIGTYSTREECLFEISKIPKYIGAVWNRLGH